MTRIAIDADLCKKLLGCQQRLELCDANGRILAHLVPSVDLSRYEPWEPVFDDEELKRDEESTAKHYTTAEVLDHLNKLGNS